MATDLYLAVGHGVRPDGKFDPGATGQDGRSEHFEAHEVVVEAVEALQRSKVSLDHEANGSSGPEDPNFAGSIRNENAGDYKLAVEVHFDWYKGNPNPVALHAGSSGGKKLADNIALGFTAEGFEKVRSVQDTKYGRRVKLAFVQKTRAPACLVECGIVKDEPREVNRKMGEAIARGICATLGKKYVEDTPRRNDYAVAVTGAGDVDQILAYTLGRAHAFKFLKPSEVDALKVGYLIRVGGPAARMYADRPGIDIVGASRWDTALGVLAKVQSDSPDRRKPWADA